MNEDVKAEIHFIDGKTLNLVYPKQASTELATIHSNIRKALESERILIETDESLLILPVSNIKMVKLTPKPEDMPSGIIIIKGAKIS